MEKLTSPGHVSRLLAAHGIRLKSKWGQNFLVDENILKKIVAAADLSREDTVLEVGAGIGALTRELAGRAGKVVTLEIDPRLIDVLAETLAGFDNVDVINMDAMVADYSCFKNAKLVANLPYNVATPLIFRWLKEYDGAFSLLVMMLQKEVAERIVALPGTPQYGSLSVVCQFMAETELLFTVPRNVFFPRPEVSSAVVRLRVRRVTEEVDRPLFFQLVDVVFQQRRKMLSSTLSQWLKMEKDELQAAAGEAGLDLRRRGETLSVTEFANLAKVIYNKLRTA